MTIEYFPRASCASRENELAMLSLPGFRCTDTGSHDDFSQFVFEVPSNVAVHGEIAQLILNRVAKVVGSGLPRAVAEWTRFLDSLPRPQRRVPRDVTAAEREHRALSPPIPETLTELETYDPEA